MPKEDSERSANLARVAEASRLERQIAFIEEADRLKNVQRKSFVSGTRRLENSAEHSWHVTLMALVLSEHATPPGIDTSRVMRMLLVHDLVEIDAGDTLLYASDAMQAAQKKRELCAADRLFALLPETSGAELRALWQEFEARETEDAKFAAAIDRLQPLLLNFMSEGAAWRSNGVTTREVLEKNRHIAEGSPALWEFAKQLIETAVQRGYLSHEL